MKECPAIIVAAFNRSKSLERLLNMLAASEYLDSDVPLVISVDGE